MIRRIFVHSLWFLLCLSAAPTRGQAQSATRVVVGFAAGGPQDMVARLLADPLSRAPGHQVIVENKAGANGAIAASYVAQAAADGRTLWLTSVGATVINPLLHTKFAYQMARDFTPVSLVANNGQLLVVQANDPANTAHDLVAESKKASLPLAVGSSGIGSVPHLVIEQLTRQHGARLLHSPYRGTAASLTDLMGGQIRALVADTSGLAPYVTSGKVKAIAVAAPQRLPAFTQVPTFAEVGLPGIDGNNWYAVFVSRKVPKATVASVNAALRAALADPAVRDQLIKIGSDPVSSSPADLATVLKTDSAKWSRLIRDAGIQADPHP